MTSTSFGGAWTERKLAILETYLNEYTTALKNQPFRLIYVDAFAGEGYWQPDTSDADELLNSPLAYLWEEYDDFGQMRDGSAKIALTIEDKPFDHFLFIEKDAERCESLTQLQDEFPHRSIEIRNEDANEALISFCEQIGTYERAVVFLDPFATEVSWETVSRIAATGKIDCWLLFPLSAIARQMPRDREPPEAWASNLDRIFGGREYWHEIYYTLTFRSVFFDEEDEEQVTRRPEGSGAIADVYRTRLGEVFHRVAPTRCVFRNSRNSPMFELFFAASNPRGSAIAVNIADYILRNW